MQHLQLMHESLARFGECFAGFLYGLEINAFVRDFEEVSSPLLLWICCFVFVSRTWGLIECCNGFGS
jgi:hypothetical protein